MHLKNFSHKVFLNKLHLISPNLRFKLRVFRLFLLIKPAFNYVAVKKYLIIFSKNNIEKFTDLINFTS